MSAVHVVIEALACQDFNLGLKAGQPVLYAHNGHRPTAELMALLKEFREDLIALLKEGPLVFPLSPETPREEIGAACLPPLQSEEPCPLRISPTKLLGGSKTRRYSGA